MIAALCDMMHPAWNYYTRTACHNSFCFVTQNNILKKSEILACHHFLLKYYEKSEILACHQFNLGGAGIHEQ